MAHRHRWWHTSTSSRDLCFFFCRCAVLSAGVGLCEPLAWTMHQPFGSIWLEIFVSAMPRDLKQLAKIPDLVEQYVAAFGKEEKMKKAHAHTHIPAFRIWADMQHPINMFAGHSINLDLAGWLYFHHCPQQGPVW